MLSLSLEYGHVSDVDNIENEDCSSSSTEDTFFNIGQDIGEDTDRDNTCARGINITVDTLTIYRINIPDDLSSFIDRSCIYLCKDNPVECVEIDLRDRLCIGNVQMLMSYVHGLRLSSGCVNIDVQLIVEAKCQVLGEINSCVTRLHIEALTTTICASDSRSDAILQEIIERIGDGEWTQRVSMDEVRVYILTWDLLDDDILKLLSMYYCYQDDLQDNIERKYTVTGFLRFSCIV